MQEKKKAHKLNSTALQTQNNESQSIDLVDVFYALLGRWKRIVIFSILGALLAGVYTVYFISPTYQAKSTIYVLNNRESAINMSDLQIGAALTSDYIKVFDMWEVHEAVISNLSLPYSYTRARKMLSVTNTANTRMLDLTVTSTDPQEAAAMVNEYANVVSEFISQKMSTEKPNIVSTALVPTNPVGPSKTRNVLIGFIIGFFIASVTVFLKLAMDDMYKTADDIMKYTGLTNLAVVPKLGSFKGSGYGKTSSKKAQEEDA